MHYTGESTKLSPDNEQLQEMKERIRALEDGFQNFNRSFQQLGKFTITQYTYIIIHTSMHDCMIMYSVYVYVTVQYLRNHLEQKFIVELGILCKKKKTQLYALQCT